MTTRPFYVCYCGDSDFFFRYNKRYSPEEVEELFERRLAPIRPHILPGLQLEDENGRMHVPKLKIELVLAPEGGRKDKDDT